VDEALVRDLLFRLSRVEDKIDSVAERVASIEAHLSSRRTFGRAVRDWLGWLVALAMLALDIARRNP